VRRLDTTQGRSDRANGGQADRPVYLDYNATTPVDPRVVDESLPFLSDVFANPASEHRAGRHARAAVEAARARIAAALGAQPGDVIFTSGATESINLALKGVVSRGAPRRKIVTFSTEHKAVLDTCAWLVGEGVSVDVLPVDRDGLPDLDVARDRIDNRTMLVSVMAANNETGVINPIQQISSMARQVGALVHCDATQAFGKVPFVIDAAVDLVSVSSHKIYGPKGIGALIVPAATRAHLEPLIHGGGHERGLRSGTLNTFGIVGFGAACALASSELGSDAARIGALRDALQGRILELVETAEVIGGSAPRLPNTLNVRLPGYDADALLLAMPSVAASTGSACTASSPAPSHVLRAMGLGYREAQECIREGVRRHEATEPLQRL